MSTRFMLCTKAINRPPLQPRQTFEKERPQDYVKTYLQLQNPDLEPRKRYPQPKLKMPKEWNGNLAFTQCWDYPYIKD